jgi:hypothetical protein
MAQRGRCRDCNNPTIPRNDDDPRGLPAGQLVLPPPLPLPAVRGGTGRFVGLGARSGGAR